MLKLHSSRLKKEKWNLHITLQEARRNEELIALSDSNTLRMIDAINGVKDVDRKAAAIQKEIRYIKKQETSKANRRRIRDLYTELDNLLYKPDYMCLIIDRDADYDKACESGFSINDIHYERLLGTNGGVKNSTIVFVSSRVAPELKRRLENGRDPNKEMVPAKFESYKALSCSGSFPVSLPRGICVVPDCVTHFKSNIIYLNDENDGEPVMEYRENEEVELIDSDGYGLMLPSLAKRWSDELGLDYIMAGANTRFSWEKGMVFCFDFLDFADKVAGTRIIKDAWGNDVDLTYVELILTTSQLKLWDSYSSFQSYLENCLNNGYTFGLTKVCPKELDNERDLNYQFIQSYQLTDEQIEELIQPTIQELRDILGLDYQKSLLFLKGMYLSEDNLWQVDDDFAKALMIEPEMINDPYVRNRIWQMLRKRIKEAKVGVIRVHGNYSIISGDPYALCQSMFGMEVTGLLKAGELYNKYWIDRGTPYVSCFRAPMTCHNNIVKLKVASNTEMSYWYRYMNTCTILNAWDTTTHATNGADKDGDMYFLTDNKVLVENTLNESTIMCIQRKAAKKVIEEKDLIRANKISFGDEIGKITNRITSMFDVQAQYPPDSKEYEVLSYRIKCGQHYQQCSIDKTKGIIAKPMPKEWYSRDANRIRDDDSPEEIARKDFNVRIVADKKPYFMRYIYPDLMKKYNTYIKNADKKSIRQFGVSVKELQHKKNKTPEEQEFLRYYEMKLPVGDHSCTQNRICKRIEQEFDGYIQNHPPAKEFDYTILKTGVSYSRTQYQAIADLKIQYQKKAQEFVTDAYYRRIDPDDAVVAKAMLLRSFKQRCSEICSKEEQLCNIVLDLCYRNTQSKQFAWDICGTQIIENLLNRHDRRISFPVLDEDGEIEFGGKKFTMTTMIEGVDL